MRALSFSELCRFRPFALVSPEFAQVHSSAPPVTLRPDGLCLTGERPVSSFAAVELSLADDGAGVLLAGLATADGDHLLATYDLTGRRATLELRQGGSTRVLAVSSDGPRPVRGLAFVLCENQASALVHAGSGWQPLVTARRSVAALADFRDAARLRRYAYAYGSRSASDAVGSASGADRPVRATDRLLRRAQAWRIAPAREHVRGGGDTTDRVAGIAAVRAGVFGMAGVRDPHLVQSPDGTPYVRDGKLYLTMTCAGLGFFQQAHWGVFTLDLEDLTKLEQVAHLFFRRDGLVLGDHAGQIIVDGERFHVLVSSWGAFAPGNIHIRHTVTDSDVLAGIHVLDTEPLQLPTDVGTWDPALTRIDGTWYVAFVASPTQVGRFDFHPALAVSAVGSAYDEGLTLVGADDQLHQCEGPVLARVPDALVATGSTDGATRAMTSGATYMADESTQGEWRLLASDADAREFPVYDLAMRRLGTLNATYGSNIPHPQIVTVPAPGGPRRLLITFDGTPYAESVLGYGSHGDLVILEASGGD